MEYRFVIPGRLPGLNEYTAANRMSPYKGSKMKKDSESLVLWQLKRQLSGVHIRRPVLLRFTWYEKDRRRDHDNVSSFGRKVIQDALVKSGVLRDDGWDDVIGFTDTFRLDRKNPRIEVTIDETEEAGD